MNHAGRHCRQPRLPRGNDFSFLQTGSNPCDPAGYQPVSGSLAFESARLRIWRDERDSSAIVTELAAWLADCLEHVVLPRITQLYGDIADLDQDGKLSVCVTSRLGLIPGNGAPVKGLVQFNDFSSDLPRPFSNQADVMFLSASLSPGREAQAIAAHEAAHLAVFSRRIGADPHAQCADDDWINEGLAHVAEIAGGGGDWSNLRDRIAAFASRPESSPLVVIDAQQQGMWRHPGARGAAWSFFTWMAQQYGEHVLSDVASHPRTGRQKLEQVTGTPFDELFRRWSVSVWTGRFSASELPPCKLEFDMHGTSHVAFPLPRECNGYRLTAERNAALQVTIVDPTVHPPKCWTVR